MSKVIGFFKRFELICLFIALSVSVVVFSASVVVLSFIVAAAYFEITANKAPPITLGETTTKNGGKEIKAGEPVFLFVGMHWDLSRDCSAYIPISVVASDGKIYQGQNPVYYSKNSVKQFIKQSPKIFPFFISIPADASPGVAQILSDPVYECSDNRSFIDNKIRVNYVDTITIVK